MYKHNDYDGLKADGFLRQKQETMVSLTVVSIGGKLTATQLAKAAEVAEKYGNGSVHLTSRQGIEIPFIDARQIDEVKKELAESEIRIGVHGPRVSSITACQGSEVCPHGCIDTYEIAKELDARYFGRELPCRFKFGVAGCTNDCLRAEENDIGIVGAMKVKYREGACTLCGSCVNVCKGHALSMEDDRIRIEEEKCIHCGRCIGSCPVGAWSGTPGFAVLFGGISGKHARKGKELLPVIDDREWLFRVIDETLDYYAGHAKPGERFGRLLERLGEEELKEALGHTGK